MSEDQLPTEQLPEPLSAGGNKASTNSPVTALVLVIIALFGVLLVIALRPGKGGSNKESADLLELQALVNSLTNEINRDRMAMGKSPLGGGVESVEDVAGRLKKDVDTMVTLATSLQAMIAEKDAELSVKSTELLRSEQLRQSLVSESLRVQGEYQKALVNSSDATSLRRELDGMKAERDKLVAELAGVRQQLAAKGEGVSKDEVAFLQRRLEETQRAKEFFEARANELQGVAAQAQARLFANSENELLPAAVELFRALRKLEVQPNGNLNGTYRELGEKLGVGVLQTLSFPTGSSALQAADEEKIRSIVANIPDGDLILCIGYASETGKVDDNQKLSSDRATAAARLVSNVKRPEQQVQAVYLGQTDRFSKKDPERNQVVEVWQIRRQ